MKVLQLLNWSNSLGHLPTVNFKSIECIDFIQLLVLKYNLLFLWFQLSFQWSKIRQDSLYVYGLLIAHYSNSLVVAAIHSHSIMQYPASNSSKA